ncbi:MAG: hypothetical protein OEY20_09630 [Gemmatimonadota bacterium]|nr:hypothetical protein [Gemmatimonadota bacterium]MDH4350778.1 hypothetical protein [Gemmatimonadota bacterium]MDH5197499.1 hypothetical protein [Gemmatimonadota bacterium]
MRGTTVALLVFVGSPLALPLAAQAPQPVIRRVQPKGFPFAVTVSAGMGFGGSRATWSSTECPTEQCNSGGAGSGWNVGAEVQVPLGQTFGFEVAGQLAHPSQRVCFRSQCLSPASLWAIRGTAMAVWRFKARAPIFFGLGGGVSYFDPAPVANQKLTSEGQGAVTEFGGATIVGYDFRFTERIGGRLAWRSYLMVPTSDGLPAGYVAKSIAWDNAFTFGVRFLLGT